MELSRWWRATFGSTNCRGTEAAKVQENIDALTALAVA
jgi:hypothetical protein